MRIAADNGFGENETAQLAAEHREHVEANMPGTTRTAKAWGDLWRRRCETISADAKAPAGLRKRVARANAKPAQVAIDPTWPHWWQQAARALGEAQPKLDSTVRYLGVEVEDALAIAEGIDV